MTRALGRVQGPGLSVGSRIHSARASSWASCICIPFWCKFGSERFSTWAAPIWIEAPAIAGMPPVASIRGALAATLVRNPGADLDAIPAERERNIGQVNPKFSLAPGLLGQKMHHL